MPKLKIETEAKTEVQKKTGIFTGIKNESDGSSESDKAVA